MVREDTDMNDDGLTKVKVVEVSEPPPAPAAKAEAPVTVPTPIKETAPMPKKKKQMTPVILMVMVVLAGIASGYALSVIKPRGTASSQSGTTTTVTSPDSVVEGKTYGAQEGSTFPDKAEGVLVKGGIDGEGSHHLMRDGGPARNVYLTSSVVDLDMFLNHLVEVDGETFNAQKAGWLMDVGLVKVLKLNAEKPFAEDTPAQLPGD